MPPKLASGQTPSCSGLFFLIIYKELALPFDNYQPPFEVVCLPRCLLLPGDTLQSQIAEDTHEESQEGSKPTASSLALNHMEKVSAPS